MQSVRDTAIKPKEEKKPWFDYNAAILLPLIQRRDFILHSLNDDRQFIEMEDGKWIDIGSIQDRRDTLRKLKKEIQDQVRIAYENYAQAKAEEILKMSNDPKKWEGINLHIIVIAKLLLCEGRMELLLLPMLKIWSCGRIILQESNTPKEMLTKMY